MLVSTQVILTTWRCAWSGTTGCHAGRMRLARQRTWPAAAAQPLGQLHQAVCLARGREAILAAVERAGGHAWVRQFAASDPAAAFCLCLSLQQAVADSRRRWLPEETRRRVEATFAPLAPAYMHIVAAQLRKGMPGSAQRALAVVRLMGGCLRVRCQCCTKGSNARESERLAQKVKCLGQDCQ